jgi:hypothetical protein
MRQAAGRITTEVGIGFKRDNCSNVAVGWPIKF